MWKELTNTQSNTSVTIHSVSASNIDVFTLEVDIVVDRLGTISFLKPNHTHDVILELVDDIFNKTLVHLKCFTQTRTHM